MKKKKLCHSALHGQPMNRRDAFHEAGHAVIDVLLGLSFEAVTIKIIHDQGQIFENGHKVAIELVYANGVIWSPQRTESVNKELLAGKLDLRESIASMAGPTAEAILIGKIDEEAQRAAASDMNGIAACCRIVATPGIPVEQLSRCVMEGDIIRGLAKQAEELLRKNWVAVEVVANELLKKESLTYSEIAALIGGLK